MVYLLTSPKEFSPSKCDGYFLNLGNFCGFFGGIFWGSLGILSEFFENSLGILGYLNIKGIDFRVNARKKEG